MRPLATSGRVVSRIWLFGFVSSAMLVIISITYVDRPLAEFFDSHFRHTIGWVVLNRALEPLKAIAVLALLLLFWAGYRSFCGHGLQPWAGKAVICCWAVVWGLATEFVFKQIFGRAWPEPTYTQNHLYGFRFLNASQHWSSFPSGTAIGSTALATTIGILFPRLRAGIAALAAMVCAAVVIENYHWLSDAIAGVFLGVSIGWMTIRFVDLYWPQGVYRRERARR